MIFKRNPAKQDFIAKRLHPRSGLHPQSGFHCELASPLTPAGISSSAKLEHFKHEVHFKISRLRNHFNAMLASPPPYGCTIVQSAKPTRRERSRRFSSPYGFDCGLCPPLRMTFPRPTIVRSRTVVQSLSPKQISRLACKAYKHK